MSREARHPCADISESQLGLVTRAQWIGAGLPERTLRWWIESGRLVPAAPCVYRVAGVPVTDPQVVLAQCLAHDGLASHRSLAALMGLHGFRSLPPEITVARGQAPRPAGGLVHECADLDGVRGRPIGPVPCTSAERLAVDLARLVHQREVGLVRFEDAVEALVRRGATDWRRLDTAVAVASAARSPGVRFLRDIVGEYRADGAESRLERRFLTLVRRAGLAVPSTQVDICDECGFVMRVDVAWRPKLVGVELDSKRHHLTTEAFEADRAKRNRARLAGWLLLEFTARQVRDSPLRVVSEVRRALESR